MSMFKQKISLLAMVLGVSGSLFAANQGGLGDQPSGGSQGDFLISMTLDGVAKVFGLDDLLVTPSALSPTDAICIYTNTDNFKIVATSGNTLFELQSTSSTVGASYTLELMSNPDASGTSVKKWGKGITTPDAAIGKVDLAGTDSEISDACATGNFGLRINATLASGAKNDTYTDTVTLLVTPD